MIARKTSMAVLLKCGDGLIRQVVLNNREREIIAGILLSLHGGNVKVLNKPLTFLEIEKKKGTGK